MPRQGVELAFLPGKSSEPSIEPAVTGEPAQAQLFTAFYKHSAIGALSTLGLTVPAMRDTIGHSLQEVHGKVRLHSDDAAHLVGPLASASACSPCIKQ
jgi:hypothetical protein